jgi:hypothetical protein
MKLLNIMGFIAFLYAGIMTATAHPMSEPECQAFAMDAVTIAMVRDDGTPKQEVVDVFIGMLGDMPEGSYIRDSEDARMVLKLINDAYDSPQHPLVFGAAQYDSCNKKVADSEV